MKHQTIAKLCTAALLTALGILLTRFFSIQLTLTIRIGFGVLPIMLAGLLLGPWWGAAVGAMADIIGFFVAPMGDFYIPGITLSTAMQGFLPGIAAWHIFKNRGFGAVLTAAIANSVVVGCLMTPLWLTMAYGQYTFIGILPAQALKALVMIPVNTMIAWPVVKAWEASPLRRMPAPGAAK